MKCVLKILLSAFIGTIIGFSLGFFGPIVFSPESNQGPLVGILVTGPLGFIIGFIVGVIACINNKKTAD